MVDWTLRNARRLIIAVIGITVLAIGVAMIFLPGPAIIVVPIGLGILATEFAWARNLLHRIKERLPRRTSE
ncbi:MAG TPA: PGPGW domain-containing protein [Geobacteraceae bacterium]|nr:PGPGW domain-containing protein [Geobacteraceae bacterium]